MTGRYREHEIKLDVDEGYVLPDLGGILPGGVVRPPTESLVEDTYYDTGDLRLLRWGCTLRHRKRMGWTVKLPVSRTKKILTRDEIDFRGRAGKPPADALTLVTPFTRGRPVQVVARLRTDRAVHAITDEEGELLVEVEDDRTTAHPADGDESTFRQLEVELGPGGDQTMLSHVADHLDAAGAAGSVDRIKVAKALGPQSVEEPDVVAEPLEPDPTAKAVLQRALARSAVQLVTQLPFALVGDSPRGVHQARVATRRIRSDLRSFEPLLRREVSERLRADLKTLADRLGVIRDADVLLVRLDTLRARHAEIDHEAAGRVLDLVGGQREVARAHLAEYVADANFHRILESVIAFAAAPPVVDAAYDPADKRLARLVSKRWRRLDKAVSFLSHPPNPSELHDVRLRAKRARYASEAVTEVFGKPARRFARSLAQVQELLGEQIDGVVAERWLAANAAQLDPEAAFAAGRLAELVGHVDDSGHADWTVPYRKAAKKKSRGWFT